MSSVVAWKTRDARKIWIDSGKSLILVLLICINCGGTGNPEVIERLRSCEAIPVRSPGEQFMIGEAWAKGIQNTIAESTRSVVPSSDGIATLQSTAFSYISSLRLSFSFRGFRSSGLYHFANKFRRFPHELLVLLESFFPLFQRPCHQVFLVFIHVASLVRCGHPIGCQRVSSTTTIIVFAF